MANQQSILFSPEISERDLDREVDQVNDQLAGVGEDVPVSFDPEEMQGDGLMPAGARGGGGGLGGAGKARTAAGLASRIPKPVAGVTAAAALPIAITGGVGVAMLGAMQSASARLQTSNQLFGTAVDNFFREPGNILDQFIVRPLANRLLNASLGFDEAIRDLRNIADGDILPDDMAEFERRLGASVDIMKRLPGPIGTVAEQADNAGDFLGNLSPSWPGWPSIQTDWPGWPNIPGTWPGWPNLRASWPGWPEIGSPNLPDWSVLRPPMPDWSGISLNLPDWLQRWTSGETETTDGVTDIPTDTNPPGRFSGSARDTSMIGLQSGGRVTETGVAEVHRGELVTDEDRLVSELASAVSQSTGGRSRTMDTSGMERKLDRLHDDLRRLESALDVTLEVGREELGRAASDGKRQDISDSNPRV